MSAKYLWGSYRTCENQEGLFVIKWMHLDACYRTSTSHWLSSPFVWHHYYGPSFSWAVRRCSLFSMSVVYEQQRCHHRQCAWMCHDASWQWPLSNYVIAKFHWRMQFCGVTGHTNWRHCEIPLFADMVGQWILGLLLQIRWVSESRNNQCVNVDLPLHGGGGCVELTDDFRLRCRWLCADETSYISRDTSLRRRNRA